MSNTVRWFSRLSLNILNNNIKRQTDFNAARTLYTETSLNIEEYKNVRNAVQEKYKSGMDIFKNKMMETIKSEKDMVFSEDLKTVIHIVEKNPEDLAMLVGLINKYCNQSNKYRFGSFKFGPIIMRALHYLNEPDIAFEIFMNSTVDDIFQQVTTYMLLVDLLYENQRYSQVREVYDKIKVNFVQNSVHPKLVVNVVAMACYKENTTESLEYGLQICKDISASGLKPMRRLISALGALALKQNSPQITIELITDVKNFQYITIRCLRIMALADLDRIDDIVIELKNSCRRGSTDKIYFYSDIVPKIEGAIERANLPEDSEICQLLANIQSEGFIQKLTLDEHISMPMQILSRDSRISSERQQSNSWSSKKPDYHDRQKKTFQYSKQYN